MGKRARILHLTDLHLGDDAPGAETGSYKWDLVEPKERERRRRLLDQTLSAIARQEGGGELTAVVISGDITYGAHRNGFEELEGLLAKLGRRRPPNERIVVVPGNHDVVSGTPPGSAERYALFREFVVERGYVVPPLAPAQSFERGSLLLDEERGFVIAPINSANWCRVSVGVGKETQALLDADAVPEPVRAELEQLRLVDPARIVGEHLEGIRDRLDEVDPERALTRIAVLHHHLLPVSMREDMRPFEGISNLQMLRNFLAVNDFRLVLHGHKHAEFAYYDRIVDSDEVFPDRRLRIDGRRRGSP
jgi:3',5'-cyclic AMP phosphodiesterase CpdA